MRNSTLCLFLLLGVPGGLAHADRHNTSREARSDEARAEARATADRLGKLMAGEIAITGASRKETSAIATPGDVPAMPPRLDAPKERFLSAGDVSALVAPHEPAIERCYLDAVGAARPGSRVELTFVIARAGDVLSLRAAASGLRAHTLRKLEGCVRSEVESVKFPERRNDTTAVVPYLFQRTDAPNAGPQLSCWNPKGCRVSRIDTPW